MATKINGDVPGLGPLENDVMRALWAIPSATVREIHTALSRRRSVAYTTIMTTMDRLHRKGLLTRYLEGNAYRYAPKVDRGGWLHQWAHSAIKGLIPRLDARSAAFFIEEARRTNPNLLDELKRAIEKDHE